jgi:acyl-CoA reductase-like NAD-dependent aldehyde dehydrogenase
MHATSTSGVHEHTMGHWIGGEPAPFAGEAIDVINPATGTGIGMAPAGAPADVDQAVAAAAAAFPAWETRPR